MWGGPVVMAIASVVMSSAAVGQPLSPAETAGVPIPEGRVEMAVAALDDVIGDVMAATGVPGLAVAVVHEGRVVLAEGYGLRRIGEDAPVTPETVFQIASLSKSLAASVVAGQVGEGVIAWDTPVAEHLPWFELADPWVTGAVTIGDLFAHRTGLPGHAGDDLEDLGFDRRTTLERLRHLPLAAFRDDYAYTNFGLMAAAEAVAAASGTQWEALSETVLYEPAGMTRTSSRHDDFLARSNRAAGHVLVDGSYEARFERRPDAQTAAGGVNSTAIDMARWMIMVLDDGSIDGTPIIDAEALLAATSPQAISSPPRTVDARAGFYGFGFGVGYQPSGRVVLSHSGAFALGWATHYSIIPSADTGIVVLSNAAPVGAVETIGAAFADLVQFGEVTRDWLAGYQPMMASISEPIGSLVGTEPPVDPEPARTADAYAGTYDNAYFGPVEIGVEGDRLHLSIGPEPQVYPLRHWSGDRFVFDIQNENAPIGTISAVDFSLDETEAMGSLRVEFFDRAGMGTFRRP